LNQRSGLTAVDAASIERTATDYIEAWLTGDVARMAACLHPDLVKRSIDVDPASGRYSVHTMTQGDMLAATRAGRGTRLPRGYEVAILDVAGNVATARVRSAAYVDYLHIARFEDRWRIVNILWKPLIEAPAPRGASMQDEGRVT
jgi:hypothetical protein